MKNPKFVDVDGIRTRYFDDGEGEPLVLVHGGNCGDNDNVDLANNWDLNWSWLVKSFHVYALRPLLSRESIQWVTQRFSSTYEHITDSWMDVRERIAKLPKNTEAVTKMVKLDQEKFLPSLSRQKDETLGWIKEGKFKVPTLLVWGYNDPSATIDRGHDLFEIVTSSAARAQMHIFNQAGHYSYREHPQDFVRVIIDFIEASRS